VDAWILGLQIRHCIEMSYPVLLLHCVIGLATLDPAAVHTDTHALL
jgi:hypothetical protein